jgi:polysaccharide export outer membrane protein
MPALVRICLALLVAAGLQACATSTSTSAAPATETASLASPAGASSETLVPAVVGVPPEPLDTTYRIGPQDLLEVEIFQVPDMSGKRRVSDTGQIVLPLVGAISIGGLTPQEAEQAIAEALGKTYLENPQVTIFVAEHVSQTFTVAGSVNKPGVFPLKGTTTLLQAVAQAEGLDQLADDDEVIIFRSPPGSPPTAYVVNLGKIHEGTLKDPILVANDRVVVPQSGGLLLLREVTGTVRGFVRPLGF